MTQTGNHKLRINSKSHPSLPVFRCVPVHVCPCFVCRTPGSVSDARLSADLIPKPSKAADDPPLYLCLIMGKRRGRKIRNTVRILSYGEEKLRSEFWFSIPRDK